MTTSRQGAQGTRTRFDPAIIVGGGPVALLGAGTASGLGVALPAPGTAPSIPPDITAAVPATQLNLWGPSYYGATQAQMVSTKASFGFAGTAQDGGSRSLVGMGGSQKYKGVTAADTIGNSTYNVQRFYEGISANGSTLANGNGINQVTRATNAGFEFYIATMPRKQVGVYHDCQPPAGDWYDDVLFADLASQLGGMAAFLSWQGGTGITFDMEVPSGDNNWDPISFLGNTPITTPPTLTGKVTGDLYRDFNTRLCYRAQGSPLAWVQIDETALNTKIEARGYQWGTAIFSNFPACKLTVYSWFPPGSCYDPVHNFAAGSYSPQTSQDQLWYGIMRAMKDLNAPGRITIADNDYYRRSSALQGSPNPNWRGIEDNLKYCAYSFYSVQSQRIPAATRDYIMGHLYLNMFTWAGTDRWSDASFAADPSRTPHGGYGNSQEGQSLWSDNEKIYRRWSMGGSRWTYDFHSEVFGNATMGMWDWTPTDPNPHNTFSFPTGRATGMLASVSTVSHDSTAITVGTIGQSRSGTTVTLTFTASHLYAIWHAHWTLYAADAATIASQGEASMVYNLNGGTYPTGFDSSFMTCTCTIPNATAGRYVIVDVYTIGQQRTSRRVQLV